MIMISYNCSSHRCSSQAAQTSGTQGQLKQHSRSSCRSRQNLREKPAHPAAADPE